MRVSIGERRDLIFPEIGLRNTRTVEKENQPTTDKDRDLSIPIRRVRGQAHGDLPLPQYMSSRAAGMDLTAALDEDLTIQPQETALVPTGIAVAIPGGFEGQIRARSGLAISHGMAVINAP